MEQTLDLDEPRAEQRVGLRSMEDRDFVGLIDKTKILGSCERRSLKFPFKNARIEHSSLQPGILAVSNPIQKSSSVPSLPKINLGRPKNSHGPRRIVIERSSFEP